MSDPLEALDWLTDHFAEPWPDGAGERFRIVRAALEKQTEMEAALRREWWLGHGHGYEAMYGDDGEMQCSACRVDFKRHPLDELHQHVLVTRAALAAQPVSQPADPPESR